VKEIVRQIMETENEVRERVEQARAEAQKIVRDAETRVREIIETGRQEAIRESQELVARQRQEAEQERARQIGAVEGGGAELLAGKSAEIEKAAAAVLEIVTGAGE